MNEAEIRNAAEALLLPSGSYNPPNSALLSDINIAHQLEREISSTHNSLSSLEKAHFEEVASGARRNGQMSPVRRFFCLFVLFDLLLVSLTWFLCIMLMGSDNIVQILKMQVLHYSISKSLFDIVLAAFCRFTVLLLFYGLLQLNTTFFIALTTLATCVFLIFKVIYYSWSTVSQPAFQVILILISFIIAWSETWFLDFRVFPLENFAFQYAQSSGRFSESLSTLLVDRNLRSSMMRNFLQNAASTLGGMTESNGNFYSPLESPTGSDDESDDVRTSGKSLNNELLSRGKGALEIAWSILNDCDWELRKKSSDGDCVYSKQEMHLGKVFLLRAKINMQPRKLLDELFLHVDNSTTWNKALLESKRIQLIDEHTDITYQVSSPGGNGVISSRDYVVLRHWDVKGDSFVLSGISIPYANLPPCKNYIRGENGPCCWAMRPLNDNMDSCLFEFLLNTNPKGWIPQYVLETALITVLLEYSACLKEHCKTLNRLHNT